MSSKIVKLFFILSLLGISFAAPNAKAASKKCYTMVTIAFLVIPGLGEEINHGKLSNWKCRKEARKRRIEVGENINFWALVDFACKEKGLLPGTVTNVYAYWVRSRDSKRGWRESSGWRKDPFTATCPW